MTMWQPDPARLEDAPQTGHGRSSWILLLGVDEVVSGVSLHPTCPEVSVGL